MIVVIFILFTSILTAGKSSVRAKLNLLEERLRGEFGGSRVIK